MSNTVIKVENLSKQYRLGQVGTGSLSHDINRLWHLIRGNEDPYLKIGEENNRESKGSSDYVWALKDINFDIQQGDRVGIIGRNGAGKSTLLKILSRTTSPTTGSVKIKGRVASLLEVGTGFHPDLSGRNNIYLNGAILGMSKRDIKSRLDEIVNFAGVERYIDTPVKRYSSGMYVRLAFAVAAHLDSDILIVDEVLAVGDAEFQKKCLGKMREVSKGQGRTILFVSHNMNAIKNLCSSVIYMRNGTIDKIGPTEQGINYYFSHDNSEIGMRQFFQTHEEAPGNDKVKLRRIEICPQLENATDLITIKTAIKIEFEFWNFIQGAAINLSMSLNTIMDECVFVIASNVKPSRTGLSSAVCIIPPDLLNDGSYYISMMVVADGVAVHNFENTIAFRVNESRQESIWHGKWPGALRPNLDFLLT